MTIGKEKEDEFIKNLPYRAPSHTDPGMFKNMRNSITHEFMQRYDSV